MKKVNKVWVVLLLGLSLQIEAAVFFSHMIEGSSSNKAIAVYNGNDTVLNLTDFSIARYNNGSMVATDTYDFTTEGFNSLLPGEVFVIANPSASQTIMEQANDTHTVTFYNGDDAIALLENGVVIDVIGLIGQDPGSGWTVGSGATNNFTLTRNSSICAGQTDWSKGSTEWEVYPIDSSAGLGLFVPQCQPVNVFISQYIDGAADNQAIEIYNAGPFAVDYQAANIVRGSNESTLNLSDGLFLSDYLQAGDTVLISNPNADNVQIINESDISHPVAVFDGNDHIFIEISLGLINNLAIVEFPDVFGVVNNDPGPGGWPVSGGSTNDSTLIRQKQICSGSADWDINANQWQTFTNDNFGDLGEHTIRDCTQPKPNLVWVWSFDTELGLFVTDGTVADAAGVFDFDIYQVKVFDTVLPAMLTAQFIESQPFQGFSWDGSVPTLFYRSNGNFTNGANFFTLAEPYYGFTSAPDNSFMSSSPVGGSTLAEGQITVVLDTVFVAGFN